MNATGRQQGIKKGRTMGIKPTRYPVYQNMFSKQSLPKERSHHRRHSGQFGLLGKPCQGTQTNEWTKQKSAEGGGHHGMKLPHGAQCNTARLNLLQRILKGSFPEALIKYLQTGSPFCCPQ